MSQKVINVNLNEKKIRTISITVIVLIVVLILAVASITIVPAGNKGVLLNMGAVSGKVLDEGLNFHIPFFQQVEIVDVRMQKYEVNENSSASKDLQTITTAIAVNYRIDSSKVNELYKNIGMSYESTVISPAIAECLKAVTAQYTAEELITKRAEVSDVMKDFLQNKLNDKYIFVDSFNVTNFEFSQAFNNAIEEKQIAEQNALKAQYDLTRIETEAQQAIVKAQGEAESMKIKNEQITQNIIMLEFIQKWDGKLPYYMGGDADLFLGMDNISSSNNTVNNS